MKHFSMVRKNMGVLAVAVFAAGVLHAQPRVNGQLVGRGKEVNQSIQPGINNVALLPDGTGGFRVSYLGDIAGLSSEELAEVDKLKAACSAVKRGESLVVRRLEAPIKVVKKHLEGTKIIAFDTKHAATLVTSILDAPDVHIRGSRIKLQSCALGNCCKFTLEGVGDACVIKFIEVQFAPESKTPRTVDLDIDMQEGTIKECSSGQALAILTGASQLVIEFGGGAYSSDVEPV